jgi:hypothetical protein
MIRILRSGSRHASQSTLCRRGSALGLPFLWALICAPVVLAGPNAGGVLLVHCDPSAEVPGEATFVDGGLAACDSAVVQAPADSTVLWFVYAAFPPEASPRVSVVSFGCQFDADSVGILWSAAPPGSTALRYEPDASNNVFWPYPGTGELLGFASPLTGTLNEIYCFAGYGPQGETFAVVANPDSVQGGTFADDDVPSALDAIVDYGSLGFGVAGTLGCPAPADSSSQQNESESTPGQVEQEGGSLESPNEGGDLTFVEMTAATDSAYAAQYRALKSEYGLQVLLGMAPDGLICRTAASQRDALANDTRVNMVTVGLAEDVSDGLQPGDPGFAAVIWNRMLNAPASDSTQSGTFEFPDSASSALRSNAPPNSPLMQTSVYMMGDVGISLLFMESDDDRTCNGTTILTENWQPGETDSAYTKIAYGIVRRLADLAPPGTVTFHIVDTETLSTDDEPIQVVLPDHSNWMQDAMDDLQARPGATNTLRMYQWNNDRRSALSFDWWFIIFVVRDICDPDHRFPPGGPDAPTSYASFYGPCEVLLPVNGGTWGIDHLDYVAAHETCHIFGAPDEYGDACVCNDTPWGYLRARNGNCAQCQGSISCIMKAESTCVFTMCDFTRAHLGWRDSDQDGILDPIDHPDAAAFMRIGSEEPLLPGDNVDITTDSLGQFHKRISVTAQNMDQGQVLWDGIGYDGLPRDPRQYRWTKHYMGNYHYGDLVTDAYGPEIGSITVRPRFSPPYVDTLSFAFEDLDTASGRVRATVTQYGASTPAGFPLWDKYFLDTENSGAISTKFGENLPMGRYVMKLHIWDVGGGHATEGECSFWHGGLGAASVGEEALGPGLALSPPHPNPSRGGIAWDLQPGLPGRVKVSVVGVDGRRVKSWSMEVAPRVRTTIVWDGADERGRRVATGRYYLLVTDGAGRTIHAPIAVSR